MNGRMVLTLIFALVIAGSLGYRSGKRDPLGFERGAWATVLYNQCVEGHYPSMAYRNALIKSGYDPQTCADVERIRREVGELPQ